MDMNNKAAGASPEILAPAGSTESIYAAVRCGADGVYVGGKDFSARANAVNFSAEELKAAVEYCHLHGVKIYRAMNTVIFDSECESFYNEVKKSAEMGIDGLIIQDMGGAYLAEQAVPDLPRHSSTQMTIHTPLGAKKAGENGFVRIVPARELSLDAIKSICETGMETEVFVHGAQCMCLSGQCYMSAVIGSRSANRGQCAQACRLPFNAKSAKTSEERYDLSLKDMSLTAHVKELARIGAASFKIEGRMKRPEYVAAAVTALRHATGGTGDISNDMKTLEAVFSRSGFTDGYLTSHLGKEMFGYRRKEDVTAAAEVLPDLAALYRSERKDSTIDFHLSVKRGTPATLHFEAEGISGDILGMIPEEARTRSLTYEDAKKQLSKLGDTRYTLGKITFEADEMLMLPASELNRMRREARTMADSLTIKRNTPIYSVNPAPYSPLEKPKNTDCEIAFRVRTSTCENASELLGKAELIIMPASECEKLTDERVIRITAVSLPIFVTDEAKLICRLKALKEKGFTHFCCENYTHLGTLSALEGITIHGGSGMNVTNTAAVKMCEKNGLTDIILSFELKAGQISSIGKFIPAGIEAYGRLPLMTVRNCPIKSAAGCKSCTHEMTDRTGRHFPVFCSEGYSRIYNSEPLELSDRLDEFKGISFAVIDISGDKALTNKDAAHIISKYKARQKPAGSFTRGLYSRGVI